MASAHASDGAAQTPAVDPYAALGQLSMAPATHTTVVTTTTTTTTSYPPIYMKPPASLRDRDASEYPLAHAPAPDSIRRFFFAAGDQQACFEEADDVAAKVHEHQLLCRDLRSANGKIRSVDEYNGPAGFAIPGHMGRAASSRPRSSGRQASTGQKRSSSPPSIAEAAEIASLHRRTKKPRASLLEAGLRDRPRSSSAFTPEEFDETVPASPDTDVGASASFKLPKRRTSPRRANGRPALHRSRQQQFTPVHFEQSAGPSAGRQSTAGPSRSGLHLEVPSERLFSTSVLDGPGIAATPPIAESDLEPVGPFAASEVVQISRPSPLDTVTAQDASLPSPSLSPITAAANLAQQSNDDLSLTADADDDVNDVSSLDISQGDSFAGSVNELTLSPSRMGRNGLFSPNPQLPTPSPLDIPNMLDSFDALPDKMKTYLMFQFLRRCTKPTLHFVADIVNPALKCDFIRLLPVELSLNIVKYLDLKSMCSAAQVSRRWRHIVDTDETAWKDLLVNDGHDLPEGELERAIREGWGWQYPHSAESYERDLRLPAISSKSENETSSALTTTTNAAECDGAGLRSSSTSTRAKRKATAKHTPSKKQKRRAPASKSLTPALARSLFQQQGPIALAEIAASAIPSPNIGLPGLRSMHLFKSLYQRHHLIRKSWMDVDTRPKHIAFRAHQRHVVTCLQFDTDKILTGSDDTNINVYDTKTGALRNRLEGHEGGVWALQYEGNTLVSGSTDRSVRVWDIEKGRCTHVFQGHTSTVRCLVILRPTQVGETEDGQPIMMPKEPLIITGSRDSTLRVWKLPTAGGPQVMQTGPPANDVDNPYFLRLLSGHHHSVRAIAAHADTLVSGSYDCTVRVWKISTGETVHRLQGHTQKVYSVVLDNARNRCISGSMDNCVRVWALGTGQCLYNLEGHTSLVGLLDLSHQHLVSAAADSTLRIWDPETGRCNYTLGQHTGAITCFQHDGQKVISGSDRTLKMWDVKTGTFIKDLLTDLSGVWQVKFNERRCVAAVQRNNITYIEVLDFGASRDGVPADQRGRRIVVNSKGYETEEPEDLMDVDAA